VAFLKEAVAIESAASENAEVESETVRNLPEVPNPEFVGVRKR